jgi:hypothetical protein
MVDIPDLQEMWFRNGDRHLAVARFPGIYGRSARSQSPFLNQAKICYD